MVTTQWKKVICEEEGCPQESQHAHIVFAPEDEPTTRIKKIKLHYCKDQECEEKENIHAHQWGSPETIEVRVSPEKEKEIRQSWEQNLSMIVDNFRTLELVIDERFDREHVAEKFWCANAECPSYHTVHSHLFNIDPNFPHFAIPPARYEEMIADRMLCE